MEVPDELESDWIHAAFEALREEVVAIPDDFGARVRGQIEKVSAETLRPPSNLAILTLIASDLAKAPGGQSRWK